MTTIPQTLHAQEGKFTLPVKDISHWYDLSHNEIMGFPADAQAISTVPDLAQNIDLTAGSTDPAFKMGSIPSAGGISRSVLNYNSDADSNILLAPSITQPFEIFFYAKRGALGDGEVDINVAFQSSKVLFRLFSVRIVPTVFTNTIDFNCGVSLQSSVVGALTPQRYELYHFTANGASSRIRYKGVTVKTGDAGTDDLDTDLVMGSSTTFVDGWGTAAQFQGQIGEVLIYNRLFIDDEVLETDAYFLRKWGII